MDAHGRGDHGLRHSTLGRWTLIVALLWTVAVAGSLWWNVVVCADMTVDLARREAEANINKDLAFRLWATKHGGVYVPVTEDTQPSPLIAHLPDRDVTTPWGARLTLMNPAYMLRQMMDRYEILYGVKGRIFSHRPLREDNVPDAWESRALDLILGGQPEVMEFSRIGSEEYLRVARPFVTEPVCMRCHEPQGFEIGRPAGAVGLNIPMRSYRTSESEQIGLLLATHGGLWVTGLVGLSFGYRQLKRSETTIRDDAERFRRVFDFCPDPAWIIEGGRFIDCNSAAVSILGYADKAALLDRHPADLSPHEQPDGEPSRQKAERMIDLARRKGLHRFEWVHRRFDGSTLDAEVTLSPMLLDGSEVLYCIWRDIGDRKQAEAGLKLARTVFENSSDGILVTDGDGRILSVNPAFSEITGFAAEEAIGQRPSILRSDLNDQEFFERMWKAIAENGRWQGEVWNRRKDGSPYIQWQTITAVNNAAGALVNYVSVFNDITDTRRNEVRIRHLAYHDALTGLPNRTLLQDRLEHGIAMSRRENYPLALLFLDLDNFKSVNDTWGHDAGDRLLQEAARRILSVVRQTDTVARLGGDEFVILLQPAGTPAEVARTAEALLATLQISVDHGSGPTVVTPSIGVALFPADAEDAASLMKHADAAMYAAKKLGRNTYRFCGGQPAG